MNKHLEFPQRQARLLDWLRGMGEVLFRFDGHEGTSPVIFGGKDDSTLLGSVLWKCWDSSWNPLKRELRPLPMLLAPQQPRR